jgi:exodeoxyribonuclease-3
MKVITCNLNGIRSASTKGYFSWVVGQNPDIFCVQETKAQMASLDNSDLYPSGYYYYFSDAIKKGYSGVGIYSKLKPDSVNTVMGLDWADAEGRFVEAIFGNLHVISIYFPSGSSGDERQSLKYDFMEFFTKNYLNKIQNSSKKYIICGDVNIVHTEKDIKNWKSNQKNSGCLPAEREWLDKCFLEYGILDGFRIVNQDSSEYTWWSNRGRARENNVGWRIDYQLLSQSLIGEVSDAYIYKDERFSDHAPLIINYRNEIEHYIA